MQSCLIADDHAMMREALAGAVALGWPEAQIEAVGDFPALWAAAAMRPDLIISDLAMPGAAPIAGITRLRDIAPGTPVLVFTGNEDDAMLLELLAHGIAGFVPKTAKSAVIEAAMRLVLAGGRYLPDRLADLVAGSGAASGLVATRPRLTERQTDVLKLVAVGQSNMEIARVLDLSPATVKAHAAAALAALGAANRAEAVFKARAARLI